MEQFAVLLTCHNRREKTLESLTCLYNAIVPPNYQFKVFLVDDGSTDGTGAAIQLRFPEVHIIQGNGKLYWNRGMHLAWQTAAQFANFDYFVWLNDDTLIFVNAFVEMFDAYRLCGSNAIICGSTYAEVTKAHTYGGKTKDGKTILPNGKPQQCEVMEGNFVLISKEIFNIVGNIDPIFPHAIGDHDYGLRARAKGIQIYIAGNYIGFCEGHESLPKWCLKEVSFFNRVKSLYSPLGNSHPRYFFIYERRHYGLLTAIKHFASIHLRILMPQLWK